MGHGHGHSHDHSHGAAAGGDLPEALDLSVPASELSPSDASRRRFPLGAGLLGAGAAASVLAHPGTAEAAGLPPIHGNVGGGTGKGGFRRLAGDHHMRATFRLCAI